MPTLSLLTVGPCMVRCRAGRCAPFHPRDRDSSSLAFRRITRALHDSASGIFAALRASPPCCCPLPVPGQVRRAAQRSPPPEPLPLRGRSSAGLDGALILVKELSPLTVTSPDLAGGMFPLRVHL